MWSKRERNRQQIEQQKVAMRAEQEKRDMIMNKLKRLIPSETVNVPETATTAPSTEEAPDCGITNLSYLNMIITMKKNFAKEILEEEKREIEEIKEYFKVSL